MPGSGGTSTADTVDFDSHDASNRDAGGTVRPCAAAINSAARAGLRQAAMLLFWSDENAAGTFIGAVRGHVSLDRSVGLPVT